MITRYGDPSGPSAPPANTGGGPIPITDLLPGIGTAVGNLFASAKPAVQRAAEYQGELNAAIARGASYGVIENWRNKLNAAKYEVEQQKAWDAQQQSVLQGVQVLQIAGAAVGFSLVAFLLSRALK